MVDAITFDAQQRLFILRTDRSVYAMRLLGQGELVHVGFGSVQGAATNALSLGGLDQYEEPNYVWENQGRRWEYPTFGDVTTQDVAVKAVFPQVATALRDDEAAHLPVRDLRLRYATIRQFLCSMQRFSRRLSSAFPPLHSVRPSGW